MIRGKHYQATTQKKLFIMRKEPNTVSKNEQHKRRCPCSTPLYHYTLYLNDTESFLWNSNVKGAKCVSTELDERLNVYILLVDNHQFVKASTCNYSMMVFVKQYLLSSLINEADL